MYTDLGRQLLKDLHKPSVLPLRGTIYAYKPRTFFASGETLCLCKASNTRQKVGPGYVYQPQS